MLLQISNPINRELINMKKLLLVLILFLTSCKIAPKITFENGYNDEYLSEFKIFRRFSCTEPVFYKKVNISNTFLNNIVQIAKDIKFFDMPYDLYDLKNEDEAGVNEFERIKIIAPCEDYRLRIQSADLDNTVTWNCNDGSIPEPIEKLLEPLKNKIYNLKMIKNLPESGCRYH